MTRREYEKLAWVALNIPRDTPQRLRVIELMLNIESMLKLPATQHNATQHNATHHK